MLIEDYQHITLNDLNELDDAALVFDENTDGNATFRVDGKTTSIIQRTFGFLTYKHYVIKRGWRRAIPFPLGAYIEDIYPMEIQILKEKIEQNPDKTFFINPLGIFIDSGMLFFHCIRPRMPEDLKQYNNVVLLWNNIPDYKTMKKNPLIPSSYGRDNLWVNVRVPYSFINKTGNKIDMDRLNNKDIPIDLQEGIYVKE